LYSLNRIMQEIKGEKQLNLIAFISIFICQTVLVITQVKINQPGMCLYDSFAMISHSLGVSIIPIAILFTMFYMRNDFSIERTVRMRSFKSLWKNTVLKIVVLSLLFAVISLLVGGIVGKFIAYEPYSWDKKEGIYFWVTGKLLSDLSYIKFIITFFFNIFTTVLLMNLIMIVLYWVFHSFVVGCFVSVALSIVLTITNSAFYEERGVHYIIWTSPYNIFNQFVYPVLICVFIILIGFFIKRRDIALINKEGV